MTSCHNGFTKPNIYKLRNGVVLMEDTIDLGVAHIDDNVKHGRTAQPAHPISIPTVVMTHLDKSIDTRWLTWYANFIPSLWTLQTYILSWIPYVWGRERKNVEPHKSCWLFLWISKEAKLYQLNYAILNEPDQLCSISMADTPHDRNTFVCFFLL